MSEMIASCAGTSSGSSDYVTCLPWKAYNNYFELHKKLDNGNFIAKCLLCVNKTLSVSKSSPTNMKIHMEVRSFCVVVVSCN